MLKLTEDQKKSLIENGTFTADQINEMCQKRTAKKIMDNLKKTRRIMLFCADVLTIKSSSGIICNTITLNLKNDENEEDITFCLPNNISVWKYLKDLDGIEHLNPIMYQVDNDEPIKYRDSIPYEYRFKN